MIDNKFQIFEGGIHNDAYGDIKYINSFDMKEVKRMYCITHSDANVKRDWRSHKSEQRWFFVIKGIFEINLIKIDNFENPDRNLSLETFILSANQPQIIHVPVGYATGFKALEPDSKFIAYTDSYIESAEEDNYKYPSDYFTNWK